MAEWLSPLAADLAVIPFAATQGVIKVGLALPHAEPYPQLLKAVMEKLLAGAVVTWQGKPYTIVGIESDRAPLQTLRITIQTAAKLPNNLWEACHSLVLEAFRQANPPLAEQLHSAAPSAFRINYRLDRTAQNLSLYITLLQGELLAPLLWGLHGQLGQALNITHQTCHMQSELTRGQYTTWEALATVEPQRKLRFTFHSPTSFKSAGIIQPFPLPELVFNSLLRRWNAFAPEALQFPAVDWSMMVAKYDLKTQAVYFNNVTEIGARGWVEFECPKAEQAAIATPLAHFAPYAGIGRKTPYGMGQVSITDHRGKNA